MLNPAEVAHGPVLIGFTFNAVLLGVMVTQVYLYYTTFKKDKIWMKIFVAALLFFDFLNTACDAAYLYESLIVHFGDAPYLSAVNWLFDTDPAITGVIVTAVQLFFAWRIWILTKSYIYPILIVATAITGGVTAILTPVEVAKAPSFVDLIESKVTISIWLSAEVLGDILITTVLVIYLVSYSFPLIGEVYLSTFQSKHKTGFERSDMLIDRIIRLTVQTGLITAIVALINLIVFLSDTTGLHLLFNFPLCKLYSNSLMSTLNSRGALMTGRPSGTSTGKDLEDHTTSFQGAYRPPVQVQVQHAPMKASDMINLTSHKPAEVYVNVESHQLKDVNGPRNVRIPSEHDIDDKRKNIYPG